MDVMEGITSLTSTLEIHTRVLNSILTQLASTSSELPKNIEDAVTRAGKDAASLEARLQPPQQ